MKNVIKTVGSQFANSPTLVGIIERLNLAIEADVDIDNFYDFVWNIETAQGFGLDIWGRIVGISRSWTIPANIPYLGFQNGTYPPDFTAFDDTGIWFDPKNAATQTYMLLDPAFRQLILLKALANISQSTCPNINKLLLQFFGAGARAYVNNLGKMSIRYTFEFSLTPLQFAIFSNSSLLLCPAGVQATMMQIVLPVFGFVEAGTISSAPFGSAPFIPEDAINAIS
jgi:hypothetical protein